MAFWEDVDIDNLTQKPQAAPLKGPQVNQSKKPQPYRAWLGSYKAQLKNKMNPASQKRTQVNVPKKAPTASFQKTQKSENDTENIDGVPIEDIDGVPLEDIDGVPITDDSPVKNTPQSNKGNVTPQSTVKAQASTSVIITVRGKNKGPKNVFITKAMKRLQQSTELPSIPRERMVIPVKQIEGNQAQEGTKEQVSDDSKNQWGTKYQQVESTHQQTESTHQQNESTNQQMASNKKNTEQPIFGQRMNASSFMNTGSVYSSIHTPYAYPKGIPRSFLQREEQIFPTNDGPKDFNEDPSKSATAQQRTETQSNWTQHQQGSNNERQVYSPSDVYNDAGEESDGQNEGSDISENQVGGKRLSAFKRLGPVTHPKKPKMTINWICNKDVREVEIPENDNETPVYLRDYMLSSTDETVVRFLPKWPWKNPVNVKKTATARHTNTVMLVEMEQMDEIYKKDYELLQITVTGYPNSWKKEDVLDTVLDSVRGLWIVPCFIEFNKTECKFLVNKCRQALIMIHKAGFVIKKKEVELTVSISHIELQIKGLFDSKVALKTQVLDGWHDDELDLKEFTLKRDVSHIIYYPLSRHKNQMDLFRMQSTVPWEFLIKLDLSHNKIKTISGFDLTANVPRLKHLNLSYNCIEKITVLFDIRNLGLRTIHLEGNPLCSDYIDKDHYIKVLKMLFTGLDEIDGVTIPRPDSIPKIIQNYCPEDAKQVVDRFLEVFFPLLESPVEERSMIQDMYEHDATLTITYMFRLRYTSIFHDCRELFKNARVVDENDLQSIDGAFTIAKLYSKWPQIIHDPHTFTVDVMYHTDFTTIFRINGILKVTAESLAEDEHSLHFTRTIVLTSNDSVEYKICNEMLYWDQPSKDCLKNAFQSTSIQKMQLQLQFESPPDDELQENLVQIFMNLTKMERKPSKTCLEMKNWHLRNALKYFVSLLKLDNLDPIMSK